MATLTTTALTPQSSTGQSIAFAATSSNGDNFLNTGKEIVLFQNSSSQGGGSSVTVTVTGQRADNLGGAASLHTFTVPIASSSMGVTSVGPFRTDSFNDTNSLVQMTYSAAGLWAKVISLTPQS